LFFLFNPLAPSLLFALSLHDALPIFSTCWRAISALISFCSRRIAARIGPFCSSSWALLRSACAWIRSAFRFSASARLAAAFCSRSEEHTSELQSQSNLVCRLLLEKKK